MSEAKKIRNLESLQKEIFRLRLSAKEKQEKLEKNTDHFFRNIPSYLFSAFSARSEKTRFFEKVIEKIFGSS